MVARVLLHFPHSLVQGDSVCWNKGSERRQVIRSNLWSKLMSFNSGLKVWLVWFHHLIQYSSHNIPYTLRLPSLVVFQFSPFANPKSPVGPVFSEAPPTQRGQVTALCFCPSDELLLAGYESGLLELWHHNTVIGHKQVKTCSRQEKVSEQMYVCVITRCVCLCLCIRLQRAPSQQSVACLTTSLLSVTWNLPLMCGNWCGTNDTTL